MKEVQDGETASRMQIVNLRCKYRFGYICDGPIIWKERKLCGKCESDLYRLT